MTRDEWWLEHEGYPADNDPDPSVPQPQHPEGGTLAYGLSGVLIGVHDGRGGIITHGRVSAKGGGIYTLDKRGAYLHKNGTSTPFR